LKKEQKIKSKYQKYVNIVFLLISAVILFLLYILFMGKTFEMVDYKPPSTMDGFNRKSQSFQPSDERAQSPGRLKWGKDFDFAKTYKEK